MNVYDFDKTIYNGDSTIEFYLYCVLKKPVILLCFPRQLWGAICYKLGFINKTQFKEIFYCFLTSLGDMFSDFGISINIRLKNGISNNKKKMML